MKRAVRVLHCPTTVGGNPQALARAERELGLESISVAFSQNHFNYPVDEILFRDDEHPLRKEGKKWGLLWRAMRDFDIIHFNFGESILSWNLPAIRGKGSKYSQVINGIYGSVRQLEDMIDLPLLKKAGKGIVVTYQGNDARQGDFCRANFEISPADAVTVAGHYAPEYDEHKRYRIAKFAKYADRIFALNPDLLHVLPPQTKFLPYANIDIRQWVPSGTAVEGSPEPKRLTVAHAPTHRGIKGTSYILEAVKRLREQDHIDFEFLLTEGLSHGETRQFYERADLLIDQLFCGWYGGLAVEFMALGKPVVCYIRDEDLKFIPARMRQDLPIINASPATIYDVLRQWLTTYRKRLPEVGSRSRSYVEQWHDPLSIAAYLKKEYEDILATKATDRLSSKRQVAG